MPAPAFEPLNWEALPKRRRRDKQHPTVVDELQNWKKFIEELRSKGEHYGQIELPTMGGWRWACWCGALSSRLDVRFKAAHRACRGEKSPELPRFAVGPLLLHSMPAHLCLGGRGEYGARMLVCVCGARGKLGAGFMSSHRHCQVAPKGDYGRSKRKASVLAGVETGEPTWIFSVRRRLSGGAMH